MLIVITGPSGCGKSTLANRLLSGVDNVKFSVSYTTRKKRGNECEGRDYYFVSEEKFRKMIQEEKFVEWAVVHGNYYGTSKSELEKKAAEGMLLLDIDVQGASQMREKRMEAVFIFILPPLFPVLQKRLEERGHDSLPEIKKRLKVAKEEIKHYREFDYVVINDELDMAVEELRSVILSQRCRTENRKKEIIPILRSFAEGN